MHAREGFVTTDDGARLFYRVHGEGPEVVIVPNLAWIESSLAPLARGRQIVFYDLRSRGRSDGVEDPRRLGISWEVADLEAVRRHVAADRVALLGHSYVATIVALYALEHPAQVTRLMMVGAMPPRRLPYYEKGFASAALLLSTPGATRLAEMRAAGLDAADPAAYARAFMRDFLIPMQLADPTRVDIVPLDACALPNEWPAHWIPLFTDHVMPSLGDWDYRPRLRTLTAPALIVHGAKERSPIDGAREWAAGFADARLLVVDGSGHFPFLEQPEAFFPAAERFLAGGWPEAAERVPQ